MGYRKSLVIFFLMVSCLAAAGKDKKKAVLPNDILEATSVVVVVDPDAGVALDAPNANQTAREGVEKAIMDWGRFVLVQDVSSADLVIEIRKGNGKMAQPTISGIPINNRPVMIDTADTGIAGAGRRGTGPAAGDPTNDRGQRPAPQIEVGQSQDMLVVYRGKRDNALDYPAVWRYAEKDALRSPGVPAVVEFRKLIVESEKQRAAATP